jgi:hypothetical protein
MPDILVRDVPLRTVEALKQRAKQNRRSLQQELICILEATAHESAAQNAARIAAQIRARLAAGGRAFGDSAALVREDRER